MILIVDDEPGVLRLCQRLLERSGYAVLTASNSERAIELLNSGPTEPIELLLADIRMPGVSGFQLMEKARQIYPELSVVLMTGFGTVEVAIEALHRGADGLILKPFEGAELIRSVENAIQDSQQRQDSIRLRVLRPLFDITETFFSETRPENLRYLVISAICNHLSAALAGLYDPVSGDSYFRQLDHGDPVPADEVRSFMNMLAEFTVKRASALQVDVLSSQNELPQKVIDGLVAYGLGHVLSIPILKDGKGLVVIAGRDQSASPFREIDYEMLGILGQEAAAALENARLYAEVRASIDKLEISQKALLQAEKIATAGRLTASIAHEINNPLQALSNCLDLAGRSELSSDVRERYLQVAVSELDRLMSTVQRMLDLFRPGAKERQWIRLDQIIQHVLVLLKPQMDGNHIRVEFSSPSDPPLILAVPNQIQQVILNLLLNAVEAMPDGGLISIILNDRPDQIVITIEDTGPGIPESMQAHLFEAFTSSKPSGTGLGLAVSYGIVQAHAGILEFIPPSTTGACFRITLPKGNNA